MRYRSDIDGLRAVAILPVLLFHAGTGIFTGGYVGVDVFFVISGYLITSILVREIPNQRYSLATFYERRIRRIIPALFATIAVSGVIAYLVFMQTEFRGFGQSVVAVAAFASNILFWLQVGYFDGPAELKPLLHTWSLAVEEQYYIVFPLVLWLVHRLRASWLWAIVPPMAISFAVSVWGVYAAPEATFYLLPGRAWELLMGSLLAVGAIPSIPGRRLREVAGLAGLAMIGWAIVTYSAATPFPGVAALLPCVGAALVIHAGGEGTTLAGRFLGLRPMVFVGLISYSLYLWHWPLIVFGRYVAMDHLTPLATVAVLGASVVIAALSWRYIEQPFRPRGAVFARPRLFAATAVAITVLVAVGGTAIVTQGLPQRLDQRTARIGRAAFDRNPRAGELYGKTVADVRRGDVSRVGVPDGEPTFLVWGDSHANAVMQAFDAIAKDEGRAGYYSARGGCAPLLGTARADSSGRDCPAYNAAMLDFLKARERVTAVVLVARWAENYENVRFADGGPPVVLRDEVTGESGDNRAVFSRAFVRTIEALHGLGRRIYVLQQVPDAGFNVPSTLGRESLLYGTVATTFIAYDVYRSRQRGLAEFVDSVRQRYPFQILDVERVFCEAGRCRLYDGERPLYVDTNHLTTHASLMLRPVLAEAIR